MIKVSHQGDDSFHNFKCGEIFCITAAVFNVCCCLCGSKMPLEQFSSHFQIQHLTLAEESINIEVLERQRKAILVNDSTLLEQTPIKEEDPADDPIKQEAGLDGSAKSTNILEEESAVVEDTEDDEDNKCLQELVIQTKAKQKKLNYREKLKEDTDKSVVSRKHLSRNAKKSRECATVEKIQVPLSTKECDEEKEIVIAPLVVEILSKVEIDCMEVDGDEEDNDGGEKQWSGEEKDTESDSDPDNDSTDELPFPCLICKRSYRSKHSLQKHNYNVHNPNKPVKKTKQSKAQHKCEECNELFRSARDLRGHKWKHTGIYCDICGKPFTQTGNMMRHKIRHTGIKAHKCKECNKEFFTDKELKSHMICHTGLMPMICEICGKRCRDRGVLTAHMRRHTGERPAKCDVCGKSFFSFHDLNVHAVTHSSERPFKCDICGSTFQRKKALRVHKLIHSKDRKHVCRVCGKGFAQSGGLNSHMRTHDAAVEKTITSSTETSSAAHIPAVAFMSRAEETPQTEADVKNSSRELDQQIIGEYMV